MGEGHWEEEERRGVWFFLFVFFCSSNTREKTTNGETTPNGRGGVKGKFDFRSFLTFFRNFFFRSSFVSRSKLFVRISQLPCYPLNLFGEKRGLGLLQTREHIKGQR